MIIKNIGIWGFGIVGKSAANYLHNQDYQLSIMDKRNPSEQERNYIKEKNITWYNESEQELFFTSCDIIIPSPGINISQSCYATHKDKWVHELDFFYEIFKKPIIAITGSIGKTSTTHILGHIFKALSIPVVVGGNIGIPTFDLINQQDTVDYAILEVSSFQLNYCTKFAPQLAIWTNFHPNHLDHHAHEQEYFSAKENIVAHQTEDQLSLVHFALRSKMRAPVEKHKRSYFSKDCPTNEELNSLTNNEQVYYVSSPARPELVEGYPRALEENPSTGSGRAQEKINLKISSVMRYAHGIHAPIMELTPALLDLTFLENIVLLIAACDLLKLDSTVLQATAHDVQLPQHRIEKVGTLNNIDFYNDSKATTTASTLAAVDKLYNRPLHLFLGGLSKGVDRAPFIKQLQNKTKHIYCFGKEAEALYNMCKEYQIPATQCATLDEAVAMCTTTMQSGDCVLLSPAGSSYDLYENYEQRGKHFKELIMRFIQGK
jgi:UDP-N-acetylmuramoylalanine--D-glutamate ligase